MITIKDKVIAEKKKELANASTSAGKDKPSQTPDKETAATGTTDEEKKAGADAEASTEASGGAAGQATEEQSKAVAVAGGDEKMECEDGEEASTAATDTTGPEVVIVDGLTDVHQEFMIR